ncbi:MAG: glucokinase [Desulfobacterales bacterium]|nr:glucokinase [Desulfobacterales bacterium]
MKRGHYERVKRRSYGMVPPEHPEGVCFAPHGGGSRVASVMPILLRYQRPLQLRLCHGSGSSSTLWRPAGTTIATTLSGKVEGTAPKIIAKLRDPVFMNAFTAKGRMMPLLQTILVRVILNPKIALLGAARYAMRQ